MESLKKEKKKGHHIRSSTGSIETATLPNANTGTVKMYSKVRMRTLGSWERTASGQGFESRLSLVALQNQLSDMCFHQEVVNMPGEKTAQARSLFGQD